MLCDGTSNVKKTMEYWADLLHKVHKRVNVYRYGGNIVDYQRLVSYIYSYPEGVKGQNVGFAKALVHQGQFKLNISLRGLKLRTRKCLEFI